MERLMRGNAHMSFHDQSMMDIFDSEVEASLNERKCVDVDELFDNFSFGNRYKTHLINGIHVGVNFFERLGSRITPKKLTFLYTGWNDHVEEQLVLHYGFVYCKGLQPTAPLLHELFCCVDADGTNTYDAFSMANPTSRLRYEIICQNFLVLDRADTGDAVFVDNRSISLEDYPVQYTGPSSSASDIAVGAIYFFVIGDTLSDARSEYTHLVVRYTYEDN